jgi:SAM-dependent methyltransferase
MQDDSGIKKLLSYPIVYSSLQKILGAEKGKKKLVDEYIKPRAGDVVLDIGCGPADILKFLPDVKYFGFDTNTNYIDSAKVKYSGRGTFKCKHFEIADLDDLPPVDIAVMVGVLHHLDEGEARAVVSLIKKALKPNGRFITQDPCFCQNQHPIAKIMIENDRGQNVRDEPGYIDITSGFFDTISTEIVHSVHRKWIPNTHCFMVCENN